MLDPVDQCFSRDDRGYALTVAYRYRGHVIRIEVTRDAYRHQSRAIAQVLTPASTWTTLASHPSALWWPDTPAPAAGTATAASLFPVAETLLGRALALLDPAVPTDEPDQPG
jgi:hypothetical protein